MNVFFLARANSGLSDKRLPPLDAAARHAYDDDTRLVHSDYRSDGFRDDGVDEYDGDFSGEVTTGG